MSLHIVLHQPEIPQNTGSIGRLCVSNNVRLHLIHPLGFSTSDYHLRRAGLDYWQHLDPNHYESWDIFLSQSRKYISKLYFFTTKGNKSHTDIIWSDNNALVFGRETAGLPELILNQFPNNLVKIPMIGNFKRSLNLAQSVAIGLYESLRQIHNW